MSNKIIQLNKSAIKDGLKELARGSMEETLNELLEKEAQELTQAAKYERTEARQGYRSGHDNRNLTTNSGDVTLKMPRQKGIPFHQRAEQESIRYIEAWRSRPLHGGTYPYVYVGGIYLRRNWGASLRT